MPLMRVTSCRKLYLRGRRIHHGLAGAVLILLGAALVAHDVRDWPWPLTDPV